MPQNVRVHPNPAHLACEVVEVDDVLHEPDALVEGARLVPVGEAVLREVVVAQDLGHLVREMQRDVGRCGEV